MCLEASSIYYCPFYQLFYLYLSSPSYLGILSLFQYLNNYLVILGDCCSLNKGSWH